MSDYLSLELLRSSDGKVHLRSWDYRIDFTVEEDGLVYRKVDEPAPTIEGWVDSVAPIDLAIALLKLCDDLHEEETE